jgi:hypothetical protein
MKKWFLPLTVLGAGGLGMLVISERGRSALRRVQSRLQGPRSFEEWDEAGQRELERIQNAVKQVADKLESVQ